MRRNASVRQASRIATSALLLAFAVACSAEPPADPAGGLGGSSTLGGSSSGGAANGGSVSGGSSSGGSSSGGAASGGSPATSGGSPAGGSSTSGGTVNGGATNGGTSATSGGSSAGGSGTSGGSVNGGASNGGVGQGGSGKGGAAGITSGGSAGKSSGGAGGNSGAGGGSSTQFSFFMTSQAGLTRLANNEKGFGGDLRFGKSDGLSGADEICRQLAETSMPGNGKTWRAFLSVTKGPNGSAVNAIDRIGEGPWYDRRGRTFAMNKAALLQARPQGADPAIINDFPNEDGVPNHNPGTGIIDNHNTLTGSTTMGTVDSQGLSATCQDWTSSASNGGKPRCGVSWPRASLINWMSVLNESGCAPGTTPGNGADSGPQGTVGGLGGYGGFYCFALTP